LTGLTVLAHGGYATVYRATQESIGRDVAVKVENRTLESDRDRQRFMREARAAGRMSSHPHVVDLFDAGVTSDNHPYLIMELCDGSYAERMRSSPLSPEEAREVGYKIADALADGHSLGVLHRDVKPANILFSNFGEPALADFGLAILSEWRDVSITLDVLTPAYAPPEAFRQAHPSPAGDVYALCATLYALMRGRPPRWREDRTPSLASVVDMFAERVPDVPGVPAEMMALLRAGMANDEASRPTAVELRDALQAMRFAAPSAVLIPPLGSPPVGPAARVAADPDEVTVAHHPHDETVPHAHLAAAAPDGPSPAPAGAEPRDAGAAGPVRPTPPGPHTVSPTRRIMWLALAVTGFAALTIVAVTAAYARGGTPDHRAFKTPAAASSTPTAAPTSGAPTATPTTRPTGSPTAAVPAGAGCGPVAPHGVSCPAEPTCFDAKKRPVACGGTHTWETFAVGQLRAGVPPTDTTSDPDVIEACSRITLLYVAPQTANGIWQVDVLAPTGSSRTYRCLAGRGPNALVGSQLARH
jgi:tRNA A-37 threonylcarbamoyl transferase component Bud32